MKRKELSLRKVFDLIMVTPWTKKRRKGKIGQQVQEAEEMLSRQKYKKYEKVIK